MEYVSWSDKYSLALPEIDAQHQELFAIINELWTCVIDSGTQEKLAELLDRLDDYVHTHFAEEEQLLRDNDYPQVRLDEHMRQHQDFAAKIDWARGRILNDPTSALQLLTFLREWLAGHISGSDRKYAEFLGTIAPAEEHSLSGLLRGLRDDD